MVYVTMYNCYLLYYNNHIYLHEYSDTYIKYIVTIDYILHNI